MNCLEIKIPSSLCDLGRVEALSINGLAQARQCSNAVTIPLFGTALRSVDDIEIPSCLWNMSSLKTLHMTGNGYVGKIKMTDLDNRLNDVLLSHNRLSGTVPTYIQSIKKVDLSYNRLVGHLSISTNTSSSETVLCTKVNRLSGRLPIEALKKAESVDILRGNMFSCDTVPENDVGSYSYICGKNMSDCTRSIYVDYI